LYYDNSKKLETTSTGVEVTGGAVISGNVSLGTDDRLRFGGGNDLQIWHNGSHSFISDQGTGDLYIEFADDFVVRTTPDNEVCIQANQNASVDLYYNGFKKFETTPDGIAVTGAITATGDITAFYTSDKTLKTNIENIPNPMDKVKELNGVSYNWTEEAQKKYNHLNDQKEIGVIAQEVEKVLPEMVTERDDGTKAVRYERMCGLLIECVKDLQRQVDELKKDK